VVSAAPENIDRTLKILNRKGREGRKEKSKTDTKPDALISNGFILF
jgi:hypothetical protein